jgi:hypothetical protein
MPVQPFTISAAAASDAEFVRPGNRINAISFTEVGAGVRYAVKLGNNPAVPLAGAGRLLLGSDAARGDAKEGLRIAVITPSAGAVIEGFISYTRPGEETTGTDVAITFEG